MLSVLLAITVAYKEDEHSVELPVKSKHKVDIIRVPSEGEEHMTNVDIPSSNLPVQMTFKSQSSPLYVKQEHKGTKGSYQKSDSEDEPHKLVHEVVKPVYQELKEIITPYRKVIQIIEKVNEERQTKVHKGERMSGYGKRGNDYGYGKNVGYGKSDRYGTVQEEVKYVQLDDLYQGYGLSY